MPILGDEVINYVNNVEYLKGQTKLTLSPNNSICGIKMPISYYASV